MPQNPLRVYFSFDYERDLHRVSKIRELPDVISVAAGGFQDAKVWEKATKSGAPAVHGLINDGIYNTSVTVVCIGQMTAYRKFITYEIERSLDRGNGIVGIRINHLNDEHGLADAPGAIPPLIGIAGYNVYKYTNKPDLVEYIREATELAAEQQQREHQRQILIHKDEVR